MLTVVLTVSTTAASEALKITSHRIVDQCTNEKRWLISGSIGRVADADSLMSFDITINFDPDKIRPTDGLTQGTLLEQMRFGDISPSFNFRVPGEMRISAFTITRNVRGDLPLFAVAGDFLGSCPDSAFLTQEWLPEFNEEFKRKIIEFNSDVIVSKAIAQPDDTYGVYNMESVVQLNDTVRTLALKSVVVLGNTSANNAIAQFTLNRVELCTIESVTTNANDAQIDISDTKDTVTIQYRPSSEDTMWISIATGYLDTATVELTSKVLIKDSCVCKTPNKTDKTFIEIDGRKPTTRITDFDDESAIHIQNGAEFVRMQVYHGGLYRFQIIDLFGRIFAAGEFSGATEQRISTASLPSGVYLLTVHTASTAKTLKILR